MKGTSRKQCISSFALGEVDLSCFTEEDNGRGSFPANGIHVKRVGGVSKFPLSCLLRLEGKTCRM